MANIQRNFIAGRMNKSLDERLVPQGEYVDALNVRLGSTEGSEIGAVENSKGTTRMTTLQYEETESDSGAVPLSSQARCIGAYEDGKNDRMYWFVHDPAFTVGLTQKLDLIVSFSPSTQNLAYHVISIDDGFGSNTTLNFNPSFLITGVDIIGDLLFFTDNFNPPRVINVTQNYPNPFKNNDVVTAEELMVIKKPPIEAPIIQKNFQSNNTDNFLEDKFLCFAYRYQYLNGEFSATSQWSAPVFDPSVRGYSFFTALNESMVNTITGINIFFNSGSSLVSSVQILYKESTSNVIKVIDKLSKNLEGYSDNTNYSLSFDNSKIFTVLPPVELLRLYDNVPLLAKSQTVMGNRLVYGNYIEGYDLKDIFNNPVKLQFTTNLITTEDTTFNLPATLTTGTYTFGPSGTITVPGSVLNIDFSSLDQFTDLKAGSAFNFYITVRHAQFAGTPTPPDSSKTGAIDLEFNYLLPENFTSYYELFNSTAFLNYLGTSANIKPVYDASGNTSCNGFTISDNLNCFIPDSLSTSGGDVLKFQSGIVQTASNDSEPFALVDNTQSSSVLKIQLTAMRFVTDPAAPPGAGDVYEYYDIVAQTASFSTKGNPTSLHSNRGYEIGVVYMDDFLRSSTALVSPENTIHIPCSNSRNINEIEVVIPWGQRAPYWARRYKFVIKPTKSTYETIYSERYHDDPTSTSFFFLLEGENAAKVETGQRLIVKRDAGGATNNCVFATVLDKDVFPDDFRGMTSFAAGAYMEIIPAGFDVSPETGFGGDVQTSQNTSTFGKDRPQGFPVATASIGSAYDSVTSLFVDYTIPAGSTINITINQNRDRPFRVLGNVGKRSNSFNLTFESRVTYATFKDWFDTENIGGIIANDSISSPNSGKLKVRNVYDSTLLTGAGEPDPRITRAEANAGPTYIPVSTNQNNYQFYRNTTNNELFFCATGTQSSESVYSFGGAESTATIEIEIIRSNSGGLMVFETLPTEALPDVWYENDKSFEVNEIGEHEGSQGWQNINAQRSSVVNTGFFDCYSFGNGVESYTIRDSIKGQAFALGNRVTTTSDQEYKQAHRLADLTYSGIFNDESNVNKLNEFNLGLLNFKPLEESFGSIQKLYARETDILVLQEDKISYVLSGKDLLSDAAGSGVLTSVPLVLGKQIARLEEFGISRNPESFAVFGPDKFFTDEQRGAVIQLKGGAYNNESLIIISETGMRGWFRDLFHGTFNAQKLGGFDPYMNEYVLSSNNIAVPFVSVCDLCGGSRNLTIPVGETVTYCVNVTEEVGSVNIDYVIPSGGNDNIVTETSEIVVAETNSISATGSQIVTQNATVNNSYTITALYNGTTTSVVASVNGTLIVPKNSVYADNMTIQISSNSITADTVEITVKCPEADIITITQIAITSNFDRNKKIHNQYQWIDGRFNSPIHTEQIVFNNGNNNPLVSQYKAFVGSQGAGVIPDDGATVIIRSNKLTQQGDTYDFNLGLNNFRFLRSSTFYGNIKADIVNLLAASTLAVPVIRNNTEPNLFSANFVMPNGTKAENNLYLIYDYRNSTRVQLCFTADTGDEAVDLNDVCCVGCNVPIPPEIDPVDPVIATCTSYTLASPDGCTTYSLRNDDTGGPSTDVEYTECGEGSPSRVRNLAPDLLPSQEPIVCSSTVPVFDNGNGTAQTGIACGGESNTFSYVACDGSNIHESVAAGATPIVRCSQNLPELSKGTTGIITTGAVCSEYYYRAEKCGTSTTIFLTGSTALGLYEVGNIVYYDEISLSGPNQSTRSCATITKINTGNGAGGQIIGQASGCEDTTVCPSLATIYTWRFDNQAAFGGSVSPVCGGSFPSVEVFSSVSSTANIFIQNSLFFSTLDSSGRLLLPFQGNNLYYGFKQPGSSSTFIEGWFQIDNTGRVTASQLCN